MRIPGDFRVRHRSLLALRGSGQVVQKACEVAATSMSVPAFLGETILTCRCGDASARRSMRAILSPYPFLRDVGDPLLHAVAVLSPRAIQVTRG